MNNRTNVLLLLLLATLLVATPVAQAQQPPTSAPDNDFILRASSTEIAGVLARHGLTDIECLDSPPTGEEVCLVRADPSVSPEQVIADVLSQEPSVTAIEEVFLASVEEAHGGVALSQAIGEVLGALGDPSTVLFDKDSTGTDRYVWTGYVEQDAANLVQASQARTVERGDGAVVAIIDTGVDPDHPLLAPHLVPGYDFLLNQAGSASEWDALDESTMVILGESTMVILGGEDVIPLNESTMVILGDDQIDELDPYDIPEAFGHGTMVAGVVHLVAPEARIMPLRVFDGDGHATVFDIVRAIYYAVDHGATVINMSFSFIGYSSELQAAVSYATSNGVRCVASVGNSGQNTIVYPASSLSVFGVASADSSDYLSSFSNYGLFLATVAAPGESIITAYPGDGWAAASGTSFAAPWISGTVALLAAQQGTGSPGDVSALEVFDALSASDPLFGTHAGSVVYGRLDIKSALDHLGQTHDNGDSDD